MFVMHGARTDEFYVSEYVRRKCTSNLSISLSFCYSFIFHSDLILLLSVSFSSVVAAVIRYYSIKMLCVMLILMIPCVAFSFGHFEVPRSLVRQRGLPVQLMDQGEHSVELSKPLGIVIEEREDNIGVKVASLIEGGNAELSSAIFPGDVLLSVQGIDLSAADFDTAMDVLIEAPAGRELALRFSDGLGTMDIAKNLLKSMETKDLYFVDDVVRLAVRKIRTIGYAQLGDLLKVEIVIGAGVRDNGLTCAVRFFALFSTDTVTTYSVNVSATGRRSEDGKIKIVSLSCAKDEGWGQTVDLIRELNE